MPQRITSVPRPVHSAIARTRRLIGAPPIVGPSRNVDPAREPPDGTFTHAASGRVYRVYRRDGQLRHEEITRSADGKEITRQDFPVRYLVGSGRFSRTYLLEVDGFLHESPITWYASKHTWDMSPGYDARDNWGFERAVEVRCLACHSGRVEEAGAVHRLTFHEKAIGCENCHGPGSLHQSLRPGERPERGEGNVTIVHPAKASRTIVESICGACHASGVAAIELRRPAARRIPSRPAVERLPGSLSVLRGTSADDGGWPRRTVTPERLLPEIRAHDVCDVPRSARARSRCGTSRRSIGTSASSATTNNRAHWRSPNAGKKQTIAARATCRAATPTSHTSPSRTTGLESTGAHRLRRGEAPAPNSSRSMPPPVCLRWTASATSGLHMRNCTRIHNTPAMPTRSANARARTWRPFTPRVSAMGRPCRSSRSSTHTRTSTNGPVR